MFTVRVQDLRRGPYGSALAFFSVVLGDENEEGEFTPHLQLDNFVLKSKEEGGETKFYYQVPSKPRIKDGVHVEESGYKKYDDHVRLATRKKGGKFVPTDAAWETRDAIITAAVAAFEAAGQGDKGRGAVMPATHPAPARAVAKNQGRSTSRRPHRVEVEEDDDPRGLPF